MTGGISRTQVGRPLRAALAAGLACLVLASCTPGKTLTADEVREQASARVLETGSDGVASLTLGNLGGSVIVAKGSDLTEYVALQGEGSVNAPDHLYLGAKSVADLPIQELVDAQASARQDCEAKDTKYGFSMLEVAPAGPLLLTRSCAMNDQVLDQTLDGQPVATLGEVDSAEALAQVLAEYTRTHGATAALIQIDYGPSVTGPVAPAITVLGEQATVNGSSCRAALKHQHLTLDGQGITLACSSADSTGVQDPFDIGEVPAQQLAAALSAAYQDIPRDSIRHVRVAKDGRGVHLVVTAEGTQGTWNLDGSRR